VGGELDIGGKTTPIAAAQLWSQLFEADALRTGIRVDPQGEPPLYVVTDVTGIPESAPDADDGRISVHRDYFTLDGKPWDGKALTEGDALIVRLRLEAREDVPDALLTDLLPGGLEVENFNLTDAEQWAGVVIDGINLNDRGNAADVRHEEFRDDRYVAALELDKGRKANVFYLVRAVSPGTFAVPPPLVEDMYRPEVRGVGTGKPAQIKVVAPGI
jgi:uncharacterized protein YfaS (alpha-2-macroglobulin family)